MVKRRYADYPSDRSTSQTSDLKPRPVDPLPSRAWFGRAQDPWLGAWGMTVEHEQRYATNHQGTFVDLVQISRQAGVTEYRVWSPQDADFILCTEATVVESE